MTPFYSNGIDADDGDYLPGLPSAEALAKALLEERMPLHPGASEDAAFDLLDGLIPTDLGDTGWGVVFAPGTPPEVREALSPLLERRREQAASKFPQGYRELDLPTAGEGPGLTAESFLRQHRAAVDGPVDPREMPYYLLLVGSPEEIGFEFQYGLDVQHAVGRICFERPEDYAAYARAALAAEDARAPRRRSAVFFGVRNDDDPASKKTLTDLAVPLSESLRRIPGWEIEGIFGEKATKLCLEGLLHQEPPAFLLTTGHGLVRKSSDERQRIEQGAIVCRDWPGRLQWNKALVPLHYYAAADVAPDADLTGLIAFHFACFSAGTPAEDDFATLSPTAWPAVAERPFVSRLAQRMLARGALAVIGHVDRVWLHSFYLESTDASEIRTFEQTLARLLRGLPAGHAMDLINRRWGTVASRLSTRLHKRQRGDTVSDQEICETFLTCNDARNYILLGDPAVRLQPAG